MVINVVRLFGCIGLVALLVALFVIWPSKLTDYDGEYPCDPEDCESCPFPHGGCSEQVQKRRK